MQRTEVEVQVHLSVRCVSRQPACAFWVGRPKPFDPGKNWQIQSLLVQPQIFAPSCVTFSCGVNSGTHVRFHPHFTRSCTPLRPSPLTTNNPEVQHLRRTTNMSIGKLRVSRGGGKMQDPLTSHLHCRCLVFALSHKCWNQGHLGPWSSPDTASEALRPSIDEN